MKYYRVLKDTFLWKSGAILHDQDKGQYLPIEDIWNVVSSHYEYIGATIIEHKDNSEYFERIYKDSIASSMFKTKDQLREVYQKVFKQ